MALKVLGIGDNVCDKYYPAMIMYPGGQAMNFSVYAKMLGASSAYMGVFGRDAVADALFGVIPCGDKNATTSRAPRLAR